MEQMSEKTDGYSKEIVKIQAELGNGIRFVKKRQIFGKLG